MITPNEAEALLEGATPGPYELEESGEQWADCPPSHGMQITSRAGHALVQKEVSERVADEWHATFELMAAAPDMAKQIAGMRYEYAVQVRRSGEWQYSRDENNFRWQDLTAQMVRADRDHPREETRIVRRLVTEPEVLHAAK